MRIPRPLLLALLLLSPVLLAEDHAADEQVQAIEAEPLSFVTRHQARIGGELIAYTATAGTLIVRDEDDKPVAEFGYTAYTRDGADPATRPLMFAWNGGPGSASLWLHMGVLGPQITMVDDLEVNGPLSLSPKV